jgi:hypothetical protein
MPDKWEAVGVLLVLLPGFACAYIVQFIGVRRKKPEYEKQTELDKVVEALLFSLLLYILTLPFFGSALPISWEAQDPNKSGTYHLHILINYSHLATLAGLAIVLALLYSAAISHGWLKRAFGWLKVTEPTAYNTIFDNALDASGGHVQLGISGGRSLIGWLSHYPDRYSEAAEEAFIFLEQAAWIITDTRGNQTEVEIGGPGILLPETTEIEYMIFLSYELDQGTEATSQSTSEQLPLSALKS